LTGRSAGLSFMGGPRGVAICRRPTELSVRRKRKSYQMGRNKGYVVMAGGKYLTREDDASGRPKLTRWLSKAAVYPRWENAMAAQDRLRGDQASNSSIVRR